MTSTPVSLNDESLNGSWIDINSASQIHSPIDNDSPERLRPPYSLAESVQSLGLMSFQVERFLQEAQRNRDNNNVEGGQQQRQEYRNIDNISDICFSDSDVSVDCNRGNSQMLKSLREHSTRYHPSNSNEQEFDYLTSPDIDQARRRRKSKSGDNLVDQLSDSLSILSRASVFGETKSSSNLDQTNNFQDFDWLWDWTAQPEYFTGQEWKVSPSKREYLMKHKQLYGSGSLAKQHNGGFFSGYIMSLLFLTNILSIIIGAGITYSILMRRSNL